jgi:hypothetical protein
MSQALRATLQSIASQRLWPTAKRQLQAYLQGQEKEDGREGLEDVL